MTNFKTLIQKYDRANMLKSIKLIPKQAEDAWYKTGDMVLPADYQDIERILVIGMGGSILGPELIKNVFGFQIKKPLELFSDYAPTFCSLDLDKTLFILSSYSGDTEEVLSWAECLSCCNTARGRVFATQRLSALKKTKINYKNKQLALKIIGITAGGQLEKWFIKNKKPYYKINTKLNPCFQPRLAVAFSAIALLGFFKKLNLLENQLNKLTINNLIKQNNHPTRRVNNLTIEQFNNSLNNRTIISQLKNRIPIIISVEHLKANAHILANQINENAKTFAVYFNIPELNHHLLPSLSLPATNSQNLIFIFLESNLYSPKNKLRIRLTQKILKQFKIQYLSFNISQALKIKIAGTHSSASLANKILTKTFIEAFNVLIWSSYLSFYLAICNQLDPSEISVLENFKKDIATA